MSLRIWPLPPYSLLRISASSQVSWYVQYEPFLRPNHPNLVLAFGGEKLTHLYSLLLQTLQLCQFIDRKRKRLLLHLAFLLHYLGQAPRLFRCALVSTHIIFPRRKDLLSCFLILDF